MDQAEHDDFLDLIVRGEERTYDTVYRRALLQSHAGLDESERNLSTEDRQQCVNAYRLGMYHGAKIGSELCCFYGLVTGLLARYETNEFSTTDLGLKRNAAILKAANDLKELLVGSPGLLKFDGNADLPVGINFDQTTFDQYMETIRTKGKLLQSLLGMHLIEEGTSQLSF